MGVGLERGHEAVQAERDDAGADPDPALVLADALPDQPGATDLGDGGEAEQEQIDFSTMGEVSQLASRLRWVSSGGVAGAGRPELDRHRARVGRWHDADGRRARERRTSECGTVATPTTTANTTRRTRT